MVVPIRIGKTGLWFSVCCVLLLLSACSMQKPANTQEARTSDEKKLAENQTQRNPDQQKEPVRIDYLAPVSGITSPEIYVYKEKRRLYVIQANVLVRDYPVGLGSNPTGDKERAGDGRTPEGDFLILRKDAAGRLNKALGLSYPGKKHAEKAFFAGLLTPAELKEIVLAGERKAAPPLNTKLGSGIYIHAGGAQRDWTDDGSISLYNSDMEELFQLASTGTPVHIRP
ncbi:MAG: L,D-transpeptidase [Syntrophobacter sp.]